MKLLFDENLSRQLCRRLGDIFPNSQHVYTVDLEEADDLEIWEYAQKEQLVIVSKDGDFHQLSFLLGAPPKVVWLRIGNCTTDLAEDILRRSANSIEAFVNDSEAAVLVLEP